MTTIFLQLTEERYKTLIDGLCLGLNRAFHLVDEEQDAQLKSILDHEAKELEAVLCEIGEQASSQISHERDFG